MKKPFHFPTRACLKTLAIGTASLVAALRPAVAEPPLAAPGVAETDALVQELVADSQKHKVMRKTNPDDALFQAEEFSRMLASDLGEYARYQRMVVAAYLKQGRVADANYVLENMVGSKTPLTWAETGQAMFLSGDKERARACLDKGLGMSDTVLGRDIESLRREGAELARLLGLKEKQRELEATLPADDLWTLEARRLKSDVPEPLLTAEELKKRIELLKAKHTPVTPDVAARLAVAWADAQFRKGSAEEGRKLLDLAGTLSTDTLLANAHPVLLEVARAAKAAKLDDLADKALSTFQVLCGKYADSAEWKGVYLSEAAGLAAEWGRSEEARKLLKAGLNSAPQVFAAFAPEPWVALARAHLRVGDRDQADDCAMNAARAGDMMAHPRAKAAAAVRVCLFYGEEKLPIPPKVLQVLNGMRSATGAP